jgi:hypothetical protein
MKGNSGDSMQPGTGSMRRRQTRRHGKTAKKPFKAFQRFMTINTGITHEATSNSPELTVQDGQLACPEFTEGFNRLAPSDPSKELASGTPDFGELPKLRSGSAAIAGIE